jgi:hypothetical protein
MQGDGLFEFFNCRRGTRRRRGGGGPGGGALASLHAVGSSNYVAVLCLARQGAKRGTGSCGPRDQKLSGSYVRMGLEIEISALLH